MALEVFSTSQKPSRVAFGSGVERKMFPMHHAPTRFGIETGIRGQPHMGPGRYSPDPVSHFLRPLNSRPRSKRGWYFGATTGTRISRTRTGLKPGPADYQRIRNSAAEDTKKGKTPPPFSSASPRLPEKDASTKLPGPGVYEHSVGRSRHVEFNEAFGGGKTLKSPVTVKCTNGIPDQCCKCKQPPVGDYYENSKSALCSACYKETQQSVKGFHDRKLLGFHKVRDCSSVHRHEFPGKDPKTILMSDKEQKKRQYREAYMRLYY